MKRGWGAFLVVLFLGLFVVSSAYAWGPGKCAKGDKKGKAVKGQALMEKRRERLNEKMDEIYSQIGLTEKQKKMLEANKERHRQRAKVMMENSGKLRAELNQALMEPKLDMKKIDAVQAKLKAANAELTDERLKSVLEIRGILSAEQFGKFLTLMGEQRSCGARGPGRLEKK